MFSKISKRIRPQKIPQGVAMQRYKVLDQGGHFGRDGLLIWGICGKLCFEGWIMGNSDGQYAGFKRYRGKNGVVVRDGELILWGMKAMPYILYLNESNHIKTSIFERNCLYIPKSHGFLDFSADLSLLIGAPRKGDLGRGPPSPPCPYPPPIFLLVWVH